MKAIFPYDDEARLKEEFFAGRNDGFFVEVGANDPVQWSQSYTFEQRGWAGVLVEPQPALAEKLRERRNAKVYAVACSSPANAGKPMRLDACGHYSSLEASHFVFGMNREGVIEVPVTTLDQVLMDAQAPGRSICCRSMSKAMRSMCLTASTWRAGAAAAADRGPGDEPAAPQLFVGPRLQMGAPHGLNSWYVPADSSSEVSWEGRLQFRARYYLRQPSAICGRGRAGCGRIWDFRSGRGRGSGVNRKFDPTDIADGSDVVCARSKTVGVDVCAVLPWVMSMLRLSAIVITRNIAILPTASRAWRSVTSASWWIAGAMTPWRWPNRPRAGRANPFKGSENRRTSPCRWRRRGCCRSMPTSG